MRVVLVSKRATYHASKILIFPMKAKFSLIFGIIVSACISCGAQSIAGQTGRTTIPAAKPYAITMQDANSRVWQRTVYELDPSGQLSERIQSFTELASGLNHLVNGQWVESSETIQILPNGTAVATNGQHQVYFPGDIYEGQIQMVMPDGKRLISRPLVLNYFDGEKTAIIAVLTNSIGVVMGDNQIIYPNAFSGIKADLRYTYTKDGFEQDIILRQQPFTPESFNLNPDTARLQVMSEFFNPPQPSIANNALSRQAGLSLSDQTLGFGAAQMIQGRAFLMGSTAQDAGAQVSKHWVQVSGRYLLVEEVPVDAILEGLASLPLTALNSNSGKHSHSASKHFKLPPQRLARNNGSKIIRMAKTESIELGYVMDYQTITGSLTNYVFQGDTTYFISGNLNLNGMSTFEGGTVIKYTNNATINLVAGSTINCQGSPYRLVNFTSMDDNSIGDQITGSSGTPTNYYANPAITFPNTNCSFQNFRISFASLAMVAPYGGSASPLTLTSGQIVNCGFGGSGSLFGIDGLKIKEHVIRQYTN